MEIDTLLNPTSIVETDSVFCCLLDDSIFFSYNKPNTLAKIEDTKFIFEHYKTFHKNGPLCVLVEMGPHASMDKVSREFLQAHKVKAICEAIVITNLAQRMLVNFYMSMKSHKHPSKVFRNRDNALVWIGTFE